MQIHIEDKALSIRNFGQDTDIAFHGIKDVAMQFHQKENSQKSFGVLKVHNDSGDLSIFVNSLDDLRKLKTQLERIEDQFLNQ